jgi:Micrococcal nuclease (thermonuclease) homologs
METMPRTTCPIRSERIPWGAAVTALLLLVLPLLPGLPVCSAAEPALEKARVTWIVDGDTISVRIGDRKESVRLLGVDSPEPNDRRDDYKQAAYDARDHLIETLKGRTVVLESDPLADDRDKHGRLLRYVVLDGKDVNLALVREGSGFRVPQVPARAEGRVPASRGGSAVGRARRLEASQGRKRRVTNGRARP